MQRLRHRDPDIAAVDETDEEEPFRHELLETLRELIDSDAVPFELARPNECVLRLVPEPEG